VGQIMLKATATQSGTLRLDVPLQQVQTTFMFAKATSSS
jgi:hypothetical protein